MNFQKYLEVGRGTVPIILSCPHGGFLKPINIPDKHKGMQIADKNKYLITKQIIKTLKENAKKIKVYYILSKIHRSKIDFNRPPKAVSAFNRSSIEARKIHYNYHSQINEFYQECINKFNKCLFIDLHGFTKPSEEYPDIILGNLFGNTLKIPRDSKLPKMMEYWGFSEIVEELSNKFSIDDGLGMNDFNLAYSGGYITYKFYERRNVNAFQLEVARYVRENLELTRKFVDAFVTAIINSLDSKTHL